MWRCGDVLGWFLEVFFDVERKSRKMGTGFELVGIVRFGLDLKLSWWVKSGTLEQEADECRVSRYER